MDVDLYERALKRSGEVVARTRVDQLSDPTPCGDWDVRALLNHIIGGCTMYAAGAEGRVEDTPAHTDRVGDDHVAAFSKAADDAVAAFRGPGAMEKTFTLPWGQTPASAALGLAVAEAAVHGWDLARATGQTATIDDDVAEAVYAMTSSMMEPLGGYPRGESFGPPVQVFDDAPIVDKAVAYLGRKP
jgi:uncharacterized protein (TIGR03086 family)